MIQVVSWTEEAKRNYFQILDYLYSSWTEKEVLHFNEILDKTISTICSFPSLHPISEFSGHRCAVFSKQTSLIYKVMENEIVIISLCDNRRG